MYLLHSTTSNWQRLLNSSKEGGPMLASFGRTSSGDVRIFLVIPQRSALSHGQTSRVVAWM